MLTPADLDLVRRDPDVPGLSLVLDGDALAAALRPLVPDVPIASARPTYVRYKPGTNSLVAYRLIVAGEVVVAYAKAYRRGDGDKLLKALERRTPGTVLGPGRIVLEEHAVVVSFFPNDRRLKSLERLADEASRARLLRNVLPDVPEAAVLRMLRYKPERRYVARLEHDEEPLAVLKWYTGSGFRTASRGASAFQSREALRVPRCLGRSRWHRVLASAWLPGRPLNELIAGKTDAKESVATAGAALAALHRQQPEGLDRLTPAAETEALHATAAGIVSPALAERARRLAEALAARLADAPGAVVPTHGDFYAEQVLSDGDTAALIDFDRSTWGDPAADLGNFIAHLERSRLCGELAPPDVEALSEALLSGYRTGGLEPAADRVALYTAAGLLQLAPHPFRNRESDWSERTAALLDRADALLATEPIPPPPSVGREPSPSRPAPDVSDPYGVAADSEMPFLRHALDPERVRHHFERERIGLEEAEGRLDVRGVRVRRYRPGRRCLIEYDLEVQRPGAPSERLLLLGKARAKGLDTRTYTLQRALWAGDFGEHGADRVCVPEPVGIVPAFQMWMQRKVPGVPATERLARPGGVALAARIAEAVHTLHRSGPPPRRRHTMADELAILHERLPRVAEQHPRWTRRIARLLDACDRLGETTPEPHLAPIHRDFYPDNVLVDGERLYLLDLDLYCEGDPAVDAGNFIAHLTEQSLRLLGDPDALRDREAAFEDAFVARAGEAARPAVRAYTLLTLARHVSISTRIAERVPFTEALLDLCEQRLSLEAQPVYTC